MPVDVQYAVAQDQLPLKKKELTRCISEWARAVIAIAGGGVDGTADEDPEVCIRLVEEEESRLLNSQFREKDKPTNVLSFPADPLPVEGMEPLLGDIVICVGVVAGEAVEQSKTMLDHLAHMVVHGMLHLYGYDHERDTQSMYEMETLEREILDRFGVDDPYREL